MTKKSGPESLNPRTSGSPGDSGIRGLSQLLLIFFMAPFGTTAVAAHTLLHRIEMVLVMFYMGIGISAGALAFLLPRVGDLGVFGVRWAMAIGMFLPGIACIIYFKSGRLKRKKV